MLKLTYTESSFYLECLTQSLEEWVAQRVVLALRVGQNLYVESTTASFLLPVDLPGMETLKAEVKQHNCEIMSLCTCDSEYMELTLRGFWLSDGSQDAVGLFVTTMGDYPNYHHCFGQALSPVSHLELFLHQLWQEAQAGNSVVREWYDS
ncbi:alr0857 family protein [Umezakia ovalisporum]|jgi:hypothetical protein|uniref:Uncharacterized protein n=2 Tax=Umezakia ovalisporum TaxID=75695 RepID=A0AA43GYB8_9CYAN|nr:alr0857 family protein [Umezakia ovalisporum]MBI1240679.1 hypothetical protein [Nostoc sp. RI_552]MDH6056034.1 hypothetical protein [Umezakia ovalisporum FSS-43]MDH6063422.1 hypothetical protein [Umezakia ovalisporum FSS-62]MDH6065711.1 hypothetical protein [Umezakia ovalisporum APH033B]MDH6069920.1 hypothetical protein [Umezakia ovalisporum CobakiLakeA]